ncbi:nascent polypeptide-associated complex protein [Candidatus Pacearchaeota archaeon]|jgi:nascent polypeptide-associated complex subunit alpha|nr:nascent polypeptide-associated complex protein [Candidatus Pacearchaeota archaeon]|tara:strand:- start:24921 stop:25253 length:333 start_codon:yes stop_codon:yes gene_type:complete
MLGGLNPKKMQALMKQMGMEQIDIEASKVIIEKTDNSKIIIDNPAVAKISMQGKETFQITGEIKEENSSPQISETDIKTIIDQTGKSESVARSALEKTGDLAEAILELSK